MNRRSALFAAIGGLVAVHTSHGYVCLETDADRFERMASVDNATIKHEIFRLDRPVYLTADYLNIIGCRFEQEEGAVVNMDGHYASLLNCCFISVGRRSSEVSETNVSFAFNQGK